MAGAQRRAVIAQEQQGVDRAYMRLDNRRSQDASVDAVYRAHNEMPAPGAEGAQAEGATRADEPLVIMQRPRTAARTVGKRAPLSGIACWWLARGTGAGGGQPEYPSRSAMTLTAP